MFKKIGWLGLALFLLVVGGRAVWEKQSGVLSSDGRKSVLEELRYEVAIQQDGSAWVDEYRSYTFLEGEFTRGFLDVEVPVDQVHVQEAGMAYHPLEAFDDSRPEGFFAVQPSGTGTRVEWYYRTRPGETRTFQVRYRVPETVTLYRDTADYFQKYVGAANAYKIRRLEVLVQLPPGADRENTPIWAHGPAGGTIAFMDAATVVLSMKNVPPGEYVEARFLLPVEAMSGVEKRVDSDRRQELLEMENAAAAAEDKDRMARGLLNLLFLGTGGAMALFPGVRILLHRTGLKRRKPVMEPMYYRDLPGDLFPAELDLLVHHYSERENVSRQITGTLLDLVYKGWIRVEESPGAGVFGNRRDLALSYRILEGEMVAIHEHALLDFLFNQVGGGSSKVSLQELKKYCGGKRTYAQAYSFYKDFESKVASLAEGRGFFERERNRQPGILSFHLFLSLGLMVLTMVLVQNVEFLQGTLVAAVGIGSLLGFLTVAAFGKKVKRLLTQEGEDQYALWKAFRKFLEEFTTFQDKELPELFLWEKYLVYATVLGVSKQLLRQLYTRYPEALQERADTRLLYFMPRGTYQDTYRGFEDLGKAVDGAVRETMQMTAKASKGSGGGFSSGGSDSGGGAGGSSGGVD
ncbi:DUF2207 domain-containing protein [Anaerotalea alkaliphila]|uniref:DUF2207 domain-containing protein n=1 Tax=Anaerotalea alkaliphila TaxID=2662126 RepID=A0A7X5HY62_9FIRM|nr:DUF2207 domain-containing protein [Anaerotalea alkaliphila]NDL68790.1 DUF2207 domain-containing protein [Anaerotalea alkaliphila]